MLRFVVATIATFGLLMLVNNAVTSANTSNLDVTIDSVESFGEFSVHGYVYSSGTLPATVELSGSISGTFNVLADGSYEGSTSAPPNTYGNVTVTATHNGETATDSCSVYSSDGGGSGF